MTGANLPIRSQDLGAGALSFVAVAILLISCGRVGFDLSDDEFGRDAAFEVRDAGPDSIDSGLDNTDARASDATVAIPDGIAVTGLITMAGNSQIVHSVAVDAAGNSYAVGQFLDSIDFGDGVRSAGTGWDAWVASWDSNRTLRWVRTLDGGTSDDSLDGVYVEGSSLFICGRFGGTADLGDGPISAAGGADALVAALTTGGDVLWTRGFGGDASDLCYSVVASGDAVFVGGEYSGDITFDGTSFPWAGDRDGFVAGYDRATGTPQWLRTWAGSGLELVFEIALSPAGVPEATGIVGPDATIGGVSFSSSVSGTMDVPWVVFDADGTVRSTRRFGGPAVDQGAAIVVDPRDGSRYLTGLFDVGASFDTTVVSANAGSRDAFLVKLTSGGDVEWAISLGGDLSDIGRSLAVDRVGNVYVGGIFRRELAWGDTTLSAAGDEYDNFVLSARADGTHRWALSVEGAGNAAGSWALAVTATGTVYLGGRVPNGGTVAGFAISDGPGSDGFILQLVPE